MDNKAQLLVRDRIGFDDHAVAHLVIWRLPRSLALIFLRISRGGTMKTVLIEVMSPQDALARAMAAAKAGKPARHAHITFRSPESMARVLTPTRWTLLETMTGAGPLGVRELARRTGRDVKGVHTDASALVVAGVIDRTTAGKYLFPFDRVKVQFQLGAAA